MTIKLAWLRTREYVDLRIFAGDAGDARPYVGQFRMKPATAELFRQLLVAGAATMLDVDLSEVGWDDGPEV